jgi:hypothetical protein
LLSFYQLSTLKQDPTNKPNRNPIEFEKLVKEYGNVLAGKALQWFLDYHTEQFRKSVHPASYIIANEYLWRN